MWASYGIWRMVGQSCARLGYGAWALMNQGFYVYEWDQDLGRVAKAPNACSLE